jgi:hypothetical protein
VAAVAVVAAAASLVAAVVAVAAAVVAGATPGRDRPPAEGSHLVAPREAVAVAPHLEPPWGLAASGLAAALAPHLEPRREPAASGLVLVAAHRCRKGPGAAKPDNPWDRKAVRQVLPSDPDSVPRPAPRARHSVPSAPKDARIPNRLVRIPAATGREIEAPRVRIARENAPIAREIARKGPPIERIPARKGPPIAPKDARMPHGIFLTTGMEGTVTTGMAATMAAATGERQRSGPQLWPRLMLSAQP